MPIRGENVGTAYVKILADGTGLSDSIRDELDDTEGEFGKSGERAGEQHSEGVRKGLKKDQPKTQKAVAELFQADGQRIREITAQLEGVVFRGIEKSVKDRHGQNEDLGARIMSDLKKGFLKNGGFESFGDNFEDLFAKLPAIEERALKAMAAEQKSSLERQAREQEKHIRETAAEQDRAHREELARLKFREDAVRLAARRQADYWRTTLAEAYQENQRFDLSRERTTINEQRRIETLAKAERAAYEERATRLRDLGTRNSRFNNSLDQVSAGLGRAFGKGARNDAVNLIGSMTEGFAKLAFLGPKLGSKLFDLGSEFTSLLASGQGVGKALAGTFTSGGESGARALASLASSGGVALVGLVALAFIIPTVVSAFALLGGAIVAVVGSISFGLVGAVGALAGAFLPVIAGISVLTAGILSLSDAQKTALKGAIKPMTEEFKQLGKVAAGAVFRDAAEQATKLGDALEKSDLERLVRRIGNSIRHIGDDWIDAVDSPGFRRFVNAMGDSLPGQLEKLGKIARQTIGGIGGIFIGLQPITDRFLGWLDRITAKFSAWANSAEGQTAIVDFFERAGNSAASLGELLDNVGEAIGELFTSGQGAGDTIIDSLAGKVQEFVDYLNANPEAVSKFFADSAVFAQKLGTAVEGITKFIAKMVTPEARARANELFNGIGQFINTIALPAVEKLNAAVAFLSPIFSSVFGAIGEVAAVFLDVIAGVIGGLGDLGNLIGKLPGVPDDFGQGFVDAATKINGVADSLRGPGWQEKINGMGTDITGVKTNLDTLTGQPYNVVVNADSLTGLATNAHKTTEELQGLRDLIYGPLGNIPPVKPAVDASSIKGGTEAVSGLTKGLKNVFDFPASNPKVEAKQVSDADTKFRQLASNMKNAYDIGGQNKPIKVDTGAVTGAIGVVGGLVAALGRIDRYIEIQIKTIRTGASAGAAGGDIATGGILGPEGLTRYKNMASGGFANFAQKYRIGESGREAIVPLQRPLGQVDPAVRMLSAFAQGKMGAFNGTTNSKTVDASGWIIQSNSEDPRRVADEVVNNLAGAIF